MVGGATWGGEGYLSILALLSDYLKKFKSQAQSPAYI